MLAALAEILPALCELDLTTLQGPAHGERLIMHMAAAFRDRLEGLMEWEGKHFRLVDTGGVYGLDDFHHVQYMLGAESCSKHILGTPGGSDFLIF